MVSGVLYHLGGKKILQISVCVCRIVKMHVYM